MTLTLPLWTVPLVISIALVALAWLIAAKAGTWDLISGCISVVLLCAAAGTWLIYIAYMLGRSA